MFTISLRTLETLLRPLKITVLKRSLNVKAAQCKIKFNRKFNIHMETYRNEFHQCRVPLRITTFDYNDYFHFFADSHRPCVTTKPRK